MTAYPEVDWPTISRKFVEALGMDFQERTTQIEPHDSQAELFDSLRHINTELIGLCRDMWLYIAFKNFKQTVKAGEVGSSTMPHKVNPIDYENAEANFEIASALLAHLSGKLPISRLQRDLTDSSAQRVIGTAFGHALVALTSLKKGLGKVAPDETQMAEELDREWAVLTEPLQTIMRRHGVKDAYETIKDLSRGKKFDEHTYIDIVSALDLGEEVKEQLLRLTPATYIGQAVKLAKTSRYDRG
jgi:adenylosuccinate lyase